jgi:hypothetical protein
MTQNFKIIILFCSVFKAEIFEVIIQKKLRDRCYKTFFAIIDASATDTYSLRTDICASAKTTLKREALFPQFTVL